VAIPVYRAGSSRVTHPFAGFPEVQAPRFVPRLACVRPAASVRPEPGSNSPLDDREPHGGQRSNQRRFVDALASLIPHCIGVLPTLTRDRPTSEGRRAIDGVVSRLITEAMSVSLAFGTLCSSQGAVVTVRRGSVPVGSASCRDTAVRVATSPGGAVNATTSARDSPTSGPGSG
jgi:hypothetical protein